MACLIVVMPAILALLLVFGYIGDKHTETFNKIAEVVFRCR